MNCNNCQHPTKREQIHCLECGAPLLDKATRRLLKSLRGHQDGMIEDISTAQIIPVPYLGESLKKLDSACMILERRIDGKGDLG